LAPAFGRPVGEGWRAHQQQRNGENKMPHDGVSTIIKMSIVTI
jgi:hypothetical protein